MGRYVYDTASAAEAERLLALEETNDPASIRILAGRGIERHWRCLEVGAGGGSIARWLSEQVPEGSVVATDLDTRFLEADPRPNLEVRRHDIVNDPLEERAFDLVHSRFLLEHLVEHEAVLDTLVEALRPGGTIVIEDVDFVLQTIPDGPGFAHPDLTTSVREVFAAFTTMMRARGIYPSLGRRLPGMFLARDLKDVGAEATASLMLPGTPAHTMATASGRALAGAIVDSGAMAADRLEAHLATLMRDDIWGMSPMRVLAWGRRPPDRGTA